MKITVEQYRDFQARDAALIAEVHLLDHIGSIPGRRPETDDARRAVHEARAALHKEFRALVNVGDDVNAWHFMIGFVDLDSWTSGPAEAEGTI